MKFKTIYDNYKLYENGDIVNKYGKKISPVDNGKNYLIVNLNTEPKGKRVCKAIHRLLGEHFIPNPNNLPEINHIDTNRRNNSLNNLEWCTHGENIKHSYDTNNRSATGTNNARCKTTEKVVHEICELLQRNIKSSAIRDLGYSYVLVRSIKSKKNWNHISEHYNF